MTEDKFSIESIIAELGDSIAILDGGAGKGSFNYADYPGCRIVALDVKPMNDVDDPRNVERVVGDLGELPFGHSVFDLVTLNFVLEHTLEPKKALNEIKRVLKPDGVFYLSVPDSTSWEDMLFRFAHVPTHPSSWFKPSPNYHHQTFTAESLRDLLAEHGFSMVWRVSYPGGFNWIPRPLRGVFLRGCKTLGLDPTRRGNFIVRAEERATEEGVYRIPYVCFECGRPTWEVSLEGLNWRCENCDSLNIYFPPYDN